MCKHVCNASYITVTAMSWKKCITISIWTIPVSSFKHHQTYLFHDSQRHSKHKLPVLRSQDGRRRCWIAARTSIYVRLKLLLFGGGYPIWGERLSITCYLISAPSLPGLCGLCLTPILACRLAKTHGECFCQPLLPGGLVMLRANMRQRYNIEVSFCKELRLKRISKWNKFPTYNVTFYFQGSVLDDFVVLQACGPCALCQMAREYKSQV